MYDTTKPSKTTVSDEEDEGRLLPGESPGQEDVGDATAAAAFGAHDLGGGLLRLRCAVATPTTRGEVPRGVDDGPGGLRVDDDVFFFLLLILEARSERGVLAEEALAVVLHARHERAPVVALFAPPLQSVLLLHLVHVRPAQLQLVLRDLVVRLELVALLLALPQLLEQLVLSLREPHLRRHQVSLQHFQRLFPVGFRRHPFCLTTPEGRGELSSLSEDA
mmetsp:Transcript_8033/g.24819  ORF Transcript_8033/g.24819 Transcript_8033/m.24819 type:complete len:220 (+) Transcript_8033:741-1400(+)